MSTDEACNTTENLVTPLRFEGVYRSPAMRDDYAGYTVWKYFRFYQDGTVLNATTSAKPKLWFNRESEHNSKGTYIIEGAKLTFSTTSSYGTVDYIGTIQNDKLFLKSHSHINNHRGEVICKFVKVG